MQWGEAGNTGNMPVPLPDETKLEDFWNDLVASAPALYQHFINAFPQLQGIVSNVSNSME